jgi:thioredoxin reductase (NADPH)
MFDYDVVIVGGGPAGLTAGLYLARANLRTLLLEAENCGGKIKNVEWIENYPGFADGIAGARLASQMEAQARKYGLKTAPARVTAIELFSESRWVACEDGRGYTAAVVIIAGGSQPKRLKVPGEGPLLGKGVFDCAFCDGGQFAGQVVAVAGGGDSGLTEALYLSKIASQVILIEALPALTASAILQERLRHNPRISIRLGTKILAVKGDSRLESLELQNPAGLKETLPVAGLLVQIGQDAATAYLQDSLELDPRGMIKVNPEMETSARGVLAAGDIRAGTPGQVASAVGDGVTAAMTAIKFIHALEG